MERTVRDCEVDVEKKGRVWRAMITPSVIVSESADTLVSKGNSEPKNRGRELTPAFWNNFTVLGSEEPGLPDICLERR